MKIISIVTLFCILCAATAYASWQDVFHSTYQEEGIQQAVTMAFTEGASPEAIINEGLTIQGVATQGMISAIYCSGADGNDIKKASDAAGIAASILVAAYNQSINECGDTVQQTTAPTSEATVLNFTGMPSPASSGIGGAGSGVTFASPSTP